MSDRKKIAGGALLLGAVLLAAAPSTVRAQDSLAIATRSDTLPVPERAVLVVDSSALVVGGAIRVLGGTTDDPEGQEGGATVLTLALRGVLAGTLAGTGVSATVSVDREALTVRFLTPPDGWRSATELVLESVFSAVSEAALGRARDEHLARLRFESGAPVRDFQERRFAALFGTTSSWARPARGTVESVANIDLAPLANRLVGAQRQATAYAALVGPIDRAVAIDLLSDFGPGGGEPSPTTRPGTRAWGDGFQEWIPTEITSAWVSLAFPASSDVRRDRLALLAHHVEEYLTGVPVRPGIVAPQIEVLEGVDGPVLLVTFAVAPEAAEGWAARVVEVVRLERDAPPDERFFAWQRRRFRTSFRLAHATADDRAAILVRDRSVRAPARESGSPETLRVADLQEAAAALGPARILLYGPQLPPS